MVREGRDRQPSPRHPPDQARRGDGPAPAQGSAHRHRAADRAASRVEASEVTFLPLRHDRNLLEPGRKGGYGVIFPEVDGCVSAGDTADAAASNAREALASHLGLLLADGDLIPDPAPLDAPLPDHLAKLRTAARWPRLLVPVDLSGGPMQ